MSIVSRVARPTLAVARSARAVRYAHFENVAGHTIPGGSKNKLGLSLRIISYSVIGFGLPFLAAKWQMDKAGSS
ncbi:hypothetical protein CspeluHIS016_0210950 [Cutaneotrichosporon spelunceum]|uniref:Cytochrome c oxidase subunit 8, mitochondrial n=1 Tax=Cutaneotrichosporon spelunceum TaxID=1672016 RepID=A0AAD3TSL0_9TREE|nr:hypothetical protein CspeluHIS016_0210950 [Cutaneotrichosporon spelunceum]